MEIKCKFCDSENIYYSKKREVYVCEDCDKTFVLENKIIPHKVFLSYGHDKNSKLVLMIRDKLKERGHLPWIDYAEIKAGDDWRMKITKGIRESKDFLAFISEYSTRVPGVCLDEISIGLGSKSCRIQTIILEKGVSIPNSISRVQWLDMSDWFEIYEAGEAIWNKWFDEKMTALYEIIENNKYEEFSGEILKLEKILNPYSSELRLKLIFREEMVGRQWIIRKVDEWLRLSDTSKTFFLVGAPGTGKSVLAAYLSHYLHNCIATFFFEWNNSDTYNFKMFLKSLAFQIACSESDYRERILDERYLVDVNTMSSDDLLNYLLLIPLNGLIDGQREQKVVIIDAIDEVGEDKSNHFFFLLKRLIDRMPSWIRFIITSRPEVNIVKSLAKYKPFFLDMNSIQNRQDINVYIRKYFSNEEYITAIERKSDGSFLCAKELTAAVKAKEIAVEELGKMPAGLAGMYYCDFERLFKDSNEYNTEYRDLLSIIIMAKESVEFEMLKEILKLDEYSLWNKLRRLSSYISVDKTSSKMVINVFHKTLADWLLSEDSGKYRVSKKSGNLRFCNYILNKLRSKNDISEYMMKYTYDHLKEGKLWSALQSGEKKNTIAVCIEAAARYGNKLYEDKLLSLFRREFGENCEYYQYFLRYLIRAEGSRIKEIADIVLEYGRKMPCGEERYRVCENAAIAYFYIGDDEYSMEILKGERNMYPKLFEENIKMEASYNFSIGLSAHDLDLNREVVEAENNSVRLYRQEGKYYDYFISMVNLFDGYMAIGNLKKAELLAKEVFELNEERYYVHVDDILNICYGNLLLEEDRIMEAFVYYEKGLKIAKEIQNWDYIYGSIWRELAVAKFGDPSCLPALEKFCKMAEESGYGYLESLGACFYFLSSYALDTFDVQKLNIMQSKAEKIRMPGHLLQIYVVCSLKGLELERKNHSKENIFALLEKCQGIKGMPEIFQEYTIKFKGGFSQEEINLLDNWNKEYVQPIMQFRHEFMEKMAEGLDDEPKLYQSNCEKCEGKCCYDGVYIDSEEEKNIYDIMKKFPEYFLNVPENCIVDGNWPGLEHMRKTEKKPYNYKDPLYPKHFTRTRCVFADENGKCMLQKAATENQLHPWFAKPRACWSFPLLGIRDGKVISPPKLGKKDPDFINESYPGYVTYLPCGKAHDDGISWKLLYKKEIEYYNYLYR